MKADAILTGLSKLYAKRKAVDKQIEAAEKNLVSAAKSAGKPAVKAKKPAVKKTGGVKRGRKPKTENA